MMSIEELELRQRAQELEKSVDFILSRFNDVSNQNKLKADRIQELDLAFKNVARARMTLEDVIVQLEARIYTQGLWLDKYEDFIKSVKEQLPPLRLK